MSTAVISQLESIIRIKQSELRKAQDKLKSLSNSLRVINGIYEEHCELFNSIKIRCLCSGFDIDLASTRQFSDEAAKMLKGKSENDYRKELEQRIAETNSEIGKCRDTIRSCQNAISSSNREISKLKRNGGQ